MPPARGPLSASVISALGTAPGTPIRQPVEAEDADPYGDDLQLALYLCYELHYQGLVGVDDGWEWDPGLLAVGGALERRFLAALRRDAPQGDLSTALRDVTVEPVHPEGVSEYLRVKGELWQMREYAAQRSLYHLKEADPHLWVVPRLRGRAKAAMVAVEYDEFGAGRADRIHARLFAGLMADLGLETACNRYLGAGSAPSLAVVNMMSLFGLHRRLRGSLVGHFAAVEITSSPGSRRLAQAMERLEAGPAAEHFYTEHVEADAVHEQLVRQEVIAGLLQDEPELEEDVAFGITATAFVEDRLSEHLLANWEAGRSSLYAPL
ncbi:iron-containing redox enzyme family protein [Streptomyces sp. NPDC059740]|uniref:iron-containing redox enzyme family protein n=1 Tax=Streptomyces sp. NPDC059740 TaxID=3346926 RepID=UPI00366268D7